jgi:hypothetical protein
MKTGISYFGVRNPDFVKVDLHIIASLGYTHILHTYSEEDLHYYQDTMAEIISASKKFGLGVYVNPWGVGRVFGGEAYSELASRNRSWSQVSNHDEPLVASCMNHPGFREYMFKWIDAVAATEADTIFWDEPHFYFEKNRPELWACTCESCKKEFRRTYGHTMPNSLTDSVQAFRHLSMVRFLTDMTEYAHNKGKRNSICLLPSHFNDGVTSYEEIASIPWVDEIATDPYWEKGARTTAISQTYKQASKELLDLCQKHGKDAQIWVKNYHINKNCEDGVVAATWAAFNEGIRNIFAWSYKGSAYMSWLRSDDPEKVWELQTQTFFEIREKCDGFKDA